jgi:poly-gamma-glutamate synthesis protein (capsule biosynthesis protein)
MQTGIKQRLKTLTVLVIFSTFIDIRSVESQPNVASPGESVRFQSADLRNMRSPSINAPAPTIRLVFTGDMNLGRCVAKASIRMEDFTFPFHLVAERLSKADLTIGSLDGTISDESVYMPCPESTNLIGPAGMIDGLKLAGFDVVSVATNHIKDCGSWGYDCNGRSFQDTLTFLQSAGIHPVGAGATLIESRRPVILEVRGIRFAFLALNQIDERVWATETQPGTAPLSQATLEQIKSDIRQARSDADVVIVLPQWGVEYAIQPEEYQMEWAAEFVKAGATLVVGNHPHIVQPVEVLQSGVAFYALGNFVFDQGHDYRRESIVVEATFRGSHLESWETVPVSINYYTYQPFWAEGAEAAKILERATTILR